MDDIQRKQQGERLKKVRMYLGMRQNEFANALGVSTGSYSKIEYGDNKLSNEMGLKLVSKFHININWVYSGQGEMISNVDKVEEPGLAYMKEDIRSELKALREHYIDFVSKLKDKSREDILEEIRALGKKKDD